jgi:RNA polymerase sigma-70 factor, ECF subfamily
VGACANHEETTIRLKETKQASFEEAVMQHLDAAYNLARWMTRNEADADDVVQEAFLRAYRFYNDLRGVNCRPWLLAIVRNTCCTWLQANRAAEDMEEFDEELHSVGSHGSEPDAALLASADREMVRQAIEELPVEFREVFVLREVEGVPYKDIAEIAGIPVGTVMSRLARARQRLQRCLSRRLGQGV